MSISSVAFFTASKYGYNALVHQQMNGKSHHGMDKI
jgi:hypothetical protein